MSVLVKRQQTRTKKIRKRDRTRTSSAFESTTSSVIIIPTTMTSILPSTLSIIPSTTISKSLPTYSVVAVAPNSSSDKLSDFFSTKTFTPPIIAAVVAVGVCLLAIIIFLVYACRRRKRAQSTPVATPQYLSEYKSRFCKQEMTYNLEDGIPLGFKRKMPTATEKTRNNVSLQPELSTPSMTERYTLSKPLYDTMKWSESGNKYTTRAYPHYDPPKLLTRAPNLLSLPLGQKRNGAEKPKVIINQIETSSPRRMCSLQKSHQIVQPSLYRSSSNIQLASTFPSINDLNNTVTSSPAASFPFSASKISNHRLPLLQQDPVPPIQTTTYSPFTQPIPDDLVSDQQETEYKPRYPSSLFTNNDSEFSE